MMGKVPMQRGANLAIPWQMHRAPSHELSVQIKRQDGKVASQSSCQV